MKSTFYDTYINKLKDKLYKGLFTTSLPKLIKAPLKESPEDIFDHAMENYKEHNRIKPKKYKIKGLSNIEYSAKNDQKKTVGIAKGTFYLKYKPQIVNFYQISSKLPNIPVIKNYRFGTPVHSFKHISKIVEHIEEFSPTKKRVIVFSLLSPCNNKICESFSVVAKKGANVSSLLKQGLSATTEEQIIQKELNACSKVFGKKKLHYNTILFPLSSKKYSGVGSQLIVADVDVFHYDKEAYKKKIKDPKVKKIYDLIQLDNTSSGQLAFESIIRIACYFYHFLRKEYIFAYHCKSGKDRTSTFDAIQQATYYYINQHKEIQSPGDLTSTDFEEIRHLSQKFLMYGLIIAYNSTSVVGLKLKNIPVAKYIFHDNTELFDRFIGHSSIVSS
jgi:hypothetical protein